MTNGYDARRKLGGLDPDTPVLSLGDKRQYRREGIVLYSDEERDLAAEVVGRMRQMRERGVIADEHRQWFDSMSGKLIAGAAVVAALGNIILAVKAILT